jgi:response regulator RpfG family c-di-GMP phosphodiesterase
MVAEKNITILYLDDEDINLFIFEANFKNTFNVMTSNSAPKALKLLDDHKDEIIVVISDMRMPDMNGLEFIKEARKKHDNMYYYILTGFEYNEDINAAVESKLIKKFFNKPFEVREIEQEIFAVAENLN